MNSFEIIKTVRLTEKGTRQAEAFNQYTVVADPRANKTQIRQAVQELFKVKVTKVNTLNVRGKARRQSPANRPPAHRPRLRIPMVILCMHTAVKSRGIPRARDARCVSTWPPTTAWQRTRRPLPSRAP